MNATRLKTLGLNIKAERTTKNLSQEKLSELIQVSMQTISQIEQGKQTPSVFIIFDISNVLGISMEELFKGIE